MTPIRNSRLRDLSGRVRICKGLILGATVARMCSRIWDPHLSRLRAGAILGAMSLQHVVVWTCLDDAHLSRSVAAVLRSRGPWAGPHCREFAQSTVQSTVSTVLEVQGRGRAAPLPPLLRERENAKGAAGPPRPAPPGCLRLLRPLGRGPRATCAQEEEEEGFRPWPWPSFRDFATSLRDAHLGLRN